jgi:hypothetical protein
LNHISLIDRDPQWVGAHLDALAAAGATLRKAAIAARLGRACRSLFGCLRGHLALAGRLQRHRLALDA